MGSAVSDMNPSATGVNAPVTPASETAVEFRLDDRRVGDRGGLEGRGLFGILHQPSRPGPAGPEPVPVLMVNGGPQARIGAHRSYVQIARHLAGLGYTVLRFDYAGLGDGQGDFVGYNKAAPSIRAALDFLLSRVPAQGAYLWSLCDGAAASSVYAPHDARILAMVLSNPYVFSDQVRSQTYIKHYYLQRVMEKDFWVKAVTGGLNPFKVIGGFTELFRKAFMGKRKAPARGDATAANAGAPDGSFAKADVKEEVLGGVCRFGKRVHFLLSTDDLTAMGFKDLLLGGGETARLLKTGQLSYSEIAGSDHTFSTPGAKAEVCAQTRAALEGFSKTVQGRS